MRVLISSQVYPPASNGQAVFTQRLAEGLARQGHHVTMLLASERGAGYRERRGGVDVWGLPAIGFGTRLPDAYFTPFPLVGVERAFAQARPQIVHIQDHYPLARWVVGAARRRRLPVVGTNHFIPENILHYVLPFQAGRRSLARLLWWTMTSFYNRLNLVTTPTRTAAHIARQAGLTAPLRAISCGVDVAAFGAEGRRPAGEVRAQLGLAPDRRLLLYVGRVDEEKDLDVLLRALVGVGDLQLAVVGSGRHDAAIQGLAAELGLMDRIVFTGFVPSHELPDYLHAADLFVMPSPAELQSIATLEAMAAGLPVVAADARALPELVVEGGNGFLFAPGQVASAQAALQRAVRARSAWAAMGRISLQRIQRHDLVETIEAYQAVYRRLISEARGAPARLRAERQITISS